MACDEGALEVLMRIALHIALTVVASLAITPAIAKKPDKPECLLALPAVQAAVALDATAHRRRTTASTCDVRAAS
jgi:hypothetical protein